MLRDDTVGAEFPRDTENDHRYENLTRQSITAQEAPSSWIMETKKTNLQEEPNKDTTLCASDEIQCHPASPNSRPSRQYCRSPLHLGLRRSAIHQLLLCRARGDQLRVGRLEEANANWKIAVHDPEFHAARENCTQHRRKERAATE